MEALGCVCPEQGGPEALARYRPGCWAADHVRALAGWLVEFTGKAGEKASSGDVGRRQEQGRRLKNHGRSRRRRPCFTATGGRGKCLAGSVLILVVRCQRKKQNEQEQDPHQDRTSSAHTFGL